MSDPSSNHTIDEILSVRECELFCASEKTCWGCIKTCNETCGWSATTDSQPKKDPRHLGKPNALQKPGKILLLRLPVIDP